MVSMRAKNRFYRYAVWFFFTGWMWALSPAAAGTAPSHAPSAADHVAPKVTLSAAEVEIGGTLLVRIDCRRVPAACRDLRVAFYDQGIMIFPSPGRGPEVQAGFVGIPLTAPPGKTHLTIEWGSGNQRLSRKVPFEIRPGMYGEETLTVDPRHVRPGPKDLERIRREQEELKKIFASSSRLPFWQGDFQIPVPGEMSGAFGTRRIFNGELLSHHTGVDFRAQTGDPVAAAASGVVRLTKDLFYSGNAVIIDHGGGGVLVLFPPEPDRCEGRPEDRKGPDGGAGRGDRPGHRAAFALGCEGQFDQRQPPGLRKRGRSPGRRLIQNGRRFFP